MAAKGRRRRSPELEEMGDSGEDLDRALAYKLRDDLRKLTPRSIHPKGGYSGLSTVKALPVAMEIMAGSF